MLSIWTLLESKSLWDNGSLIIANIKQDISYYQGASTWATRYNEAIWLAKNGKYTQAKSLISPLLNDTTLPKKSEISEFYGDLIYAASGSIDDSIRMYERSLLFQQNERIKTKIDYIKNHMPKTLSGSITETKVSSGSHQSWSLEKSIKKEELQKIGQQRANFLSNYTPSNDESQKNIKKLIELSSSETLQFTQDW